VTRSLWWLVAVAIAASGCVSTTVQEIRRASTGISPTESVVVLGRHENTAAESEGDFVSCVSNHLGHGSNSVGVIDEQRFMDALYPWFEPRTAPLNTSDLPGLMDKPLLAHRLRSIGARYLVWIEGNTQVTDKGGALTCSISPTGAGCFGFLSWENDSAYEAQIWDIKNGTEVGKISSDANGTSFMPAVIVPVPFIARVQSSACNSLADQLKIYITKGS
jgi:hypothetical protein